VAYVLSHHQEGEPIIDAASLPRQIAHADDRPPPVRDAVTTIREDGSRRFLFPADVRALHAGPAGFAASLLIAVYLLLPWIKVGGYPAVFLDVASRRFHLFGSPWRPRTCGSCSS
jgi:hypothetical protein